MNNEFSFNNRGILKWLLFVAVITFLLEILFSPAAWLFGIGIVLIITGTFTKSARTNQWMSWQIEGPFSWFEGWAISTGVIITTIHLSIVIYNLIINN